MLRKFVTGMPRMQLDHDAIAGHLRDHTGRGDAETQAVASDERGLRVRKGPHRKAIDQDMIRRQRQRGHGAPHGLMRGTQNVNAIDLFDFHDRGGPANLRVPGQFEEERLALFRGELLGIVERSMAKLFRQNRRGRNDRSGEWTASRLIDPGNADKATGAQGAFVPQTALHRRTRGETA
jgi:hypothetical protein